MATGRPKLRHLTFDSPGTANPSEKTEPCSVVSAVQDVSPGWRTARREPHARCGPGRRTAGSSEDGLVDGRLGIGTNGTEEDLEVAHVRVLEAMNDLG